MGKPSDSDISAAAVGLRAFTITGRRGHGVGRHHGSGWNATPQLLPEEATSIA